jgi:hypothetical protein
VIFRGNQLYDGGTFAKFSAVNGHFQMNVMYELMKHPVYSDSYRDVFTTSWRSLHTGTSYELHLQDLTIRPAITFQWQEPWHATDSVSYENGAYLDKTCTRLSMSVPVEYIMSRDVAISGGVDYWHDQGTANSNLSFNNFGMDGTEPRTCIKYHNFSLFGQMELATSLANITLGGRIDYNSSYGSVWVPRCAITRSFGATHVKLLLSRSFRAPSIENISLNPAIKPEKTWVAEIECGQKFGDHFSATVNAYYLLVKSPIVYVADDANGTYLNISQTGSTGIEAAFHYQSRWGSLSANYSWYTPLDNVANLYHPDYTYNEFRLAVPLTTHMAFANHSGSVRASYNFTDDVTISSSAAVIAERWGYERFVDVHTMHSFPTLVLMNTSLTIKNIFPHCSLQVSAFNILNHNSSFIFAYDSDTASSPVPDKSRELSARLIFDL